MLKNDGWKAKEMMENPAHHLWTDHDLHNRVTGLLNNNYGTCKSIAEEIKISLDGLEEELTYLDKVVNQQRFKVLYIAQIRQGLESASFAGNRNIDIS